MSFASSPPSADPAGSPARIANDPALMRDILERQLQPPAGGSVSVRDCRIDHARRRDGARGSVQYDLLIEDPATGHSWNQVVTGVIYGGGRTRRVWQSLGEAELRSGEADDRPALPPFAYVPDLDMLVQVFPYDHRLPALAGLMAGPLPEIVPALLARFGAGEWRVAGWEAEPVRYRVDQRATVRLTVRAEEPDTGRVADRRFYVKVYRNDDEGRRGLHAQREVHDGAAAAGASFAVAEPVAYVDNLRTLVQADVPGVSLHAILRQRGDPIPPVRAAARAVAEFHRLNLAAPPPPMGEEFHRLRNAEARLRSDRPDLADAVAGLVDAVAAGLGDLPPGPNHGDLKPGHFLFDGDRLALIDFDLLGLGDPLRDVANLVVHLAKTRSRSTRAGDQAGGAVGAFVAEYAAQVPDAWRARIPLDRLPTGGDRSRSPTPGRR